MLVNVNTLEWQVLRAVLRFKGTGGCPGNTLRLTPNRRTKDGSFLDDMAKEGLLEAVGPPSAQVAGEDVPEAFRCKWKLTELGKHAAEYGEYEDGSGKLNLPTPEEFAALKAGGKPPAPAKKK